MHFINYVSLIQMIVSMIQSCIFSRGSECEYYLIFWWCDRDYHFLISVIFYDPEEQSSGSAFRNKLIININKLIVINNKLIPYKYFDSISWEYSISYSKLDFADIIPYKYFDSISWEYSISYSKLDFADESLFYHTWQNNIITK